MIGLFLRNYDNFFEYYNIFTQEILRINENVNSIGFFSKNDVGVLKIYVLNKKINISLNDLIITVNDNTRCQIVGKRLIISDNFSTIELNCLDSKHIEDNPFYEMEQEDYKLCVLIFNILNNKDRREIFIENNSGTTPNS